MKDDADSSSQFRPVSDDNISHSVTNGMTTHSQRVTKLAVSAGHWIQLSYHHHFGPELTTILWSRLIQCTYLGKTRFRTLSGQKCDCP